MDSQFKAEMAYILEAIDCQDAFEVLHLVFVSCSAMGSNRVFADREAVCWGEEGNQNIYVQGYS